MYKTGLSYYTYLQSSLIKNIAVQLCVFRKVVLSLKNIKAISCIERGDLLD